MCSEVPPRDVLFMGDNTCRTKLNNQGFKKEHVGYTTMGKILNSFEFNRARLSFKYLSIYIYIYIVGKITIINIPLGMVYNYHLYL